MATTFKTSKNVDTDEVRHVNSLADVIARELGRPLRRGDKLLWRCPFHPDQSPSFTVYRDEHYHCFGCGAHGDVITWIMQRQGLDFIAACQMLDPSCGAGKMSTNPNFRNASPTETSSKGCRIETPETPSEAWQEAALGVVADAEFCLWDRRSEASRDIRSYLEKRGLREAILQEYHIGYNSAERYFPNVKLWVPMGITIPYWHNSLGTLYGLNVRLSDEALARWKATTDKDDKYLLAKGSKRAPLGMDSIGGKDCVFVLEGEFDTLLTLQTLRAMGNKAKHVGAFTMGSASSQDVDRWLLLYPELLDPARYLIATDRDKAGQQAASKWTEKITPGRARTWPPPSPCKDVTELWQKHGYEGVLWWILTALEKYGFLDDA